MLENNASPKTKNTKGETPYDLAVKNGYQSIIALFASSMGQDMLDKMSNSKKGKGKAAKKKKEESEEEEAEEEEESDEDSPQPKKYKEKLPKVLLSHTQSFYLKSTSHCVIVLRIPYNLLSYLMTSFDCFADTVSVAGNHHLL